MSVLNAGTVVILSEEIKVLLMYDVEDPDDLIIGLSETGEKVSFYKEDIINISGDKEFHLKTGLGQVVMTVTGQKAWMEYTDSNFAVTDTGVTIQVMECERYNIQHDEELVIKYIPHKQVVLEKMHAGAEIFRIKDRPILDIKGNMYTTSGLAVKDAVKYFEELPELKTIRTRSLASNAPSAYKKVNNKIIKIMNNGDELTLTDNNKKTKEYFQEVAADIYQSAAKQPVYKEFRDLRKKRMEIFEEAYKLAMKIKCGECRSDTVPATPEETERYCQLRIQLEEIDNKLNKILEEDLNTKTDR